MLRGNAQPLFVSGDVDGFFGIAIDNLIQFLLILTLCTAVLGFPTSLILGTILPGAALSILVGNLFYAWQAQKLSARTARDDVTALPYGINTVSLFAYVLLVMAPAKKAAMDSGMSAEDAAHLAWQIGLASCFISGIIEFGGSFVAERLRRATPRAALLSTLAGIAISFIAIDFAIRTFANPLVALLPLGVILTTYFAHTRMPLRIPGGAWAVALGTAAAWIVYALGEPSPVSGAKLSGAAHAVSFYLPIPVIGDLIAGLGHEMTREFLVPVMLPMGLFNVLGSLQNIESAEAAGDSYPTMPCLAVNGLGSIVAAGFGSCFPTTIYIGHPGWKGLGARSGYSILNAIFFVIVALLGLTSVIEAVVPIEAGMAIVLWIGIVITAQAFQATPREHAPAVSVGLFPAIAAWGVLIVTLVLGAVGVAIDQAGVTLATAEAPMKTDELARMVLGNPGAFSIAGLNLEGLVATSQGFMLTCLVWAAASTHLIDKKFGTAAVWALVGAVISFFGFVHAGTLTPSGAVYDIGWATGWHWSIGYLLCAVFFAVMYLWAGREQETA